MRVLAIALAVVACSASTAADLGLRPCEPRAPTHEYWGAWGTGDESAPLVKLGAYADAAWPTDCTPDDGDRITLGDGHYEQAYGGAWLEASHHGPTVRVVDDVLPHVRFAVASNTQPELAVYGCVQMFLDVGTTTCPAGVDGAWYVLVLCDGACPLHGLVAAPK